MAFRLLSIRDQAVQNLLWEHIEPSNFRPEPNYTKLDAITFVANQVHEGNQILWGDETALLRCEANRFTGIITPHILGDGKKFKALLTEGCAYAKSKGWVEVQIWTTRGTIQRLAMRMGFELMTVLPGFHPIPNGVEDVAILRKVL